LLPAGESDQWQAFLDAARILVEEHLDVDALLPLHKPPSISPWKETAAQSHMQSHSHVTIAVARDEAFSFIYPENLELLEEAGARVVFFSPLHDASLPAQTDGIILSGGFPEMYAAKLSANQSMKSALKTAHEHQLPILAECGGLMYLTESIRDVDGDVWPMAGLLPGTSVMTKKLRLGYRLAEAAVDGPLLTAGETVRGHEFHYSNWENRPESLQPAFALHHRAKTEERIQWDGAVIGNLWATYIHTHFLNAPHIAVRFVSACLAARNKS
jgi:cobyrinic acid a,c-diamide synthase